MTKPDKERKYILIAVAVLILIAYICRIPGIGGRFFRELGLIRSAILFLLVMTNDLHRLVFTFPRGMAEENGYAVGYYLVWGWLTICALMLLFVLYHKCRIPGSRRKRKSWKAAACLACGGGWKPQGEP